MSDFGSPRGGPDSAGIFRVLAGLPGRDPAQVELDRVSAWAMGPSVTRRRRIARVPPCCDQRGRYGHRGSAGWWSRCPSKEAAR